MTLRFSMTFRVQHDIEMLKHPEHISGHHDFKTILIVEVHRVFPVF